MGPKPPELKRFELNFLGNVRVDFNLLLIKEGVTHD